MGSVHKVLLTRGLSGFIGARVCAQNGKTGTVLVALNETCCLFAHKDQCKRAHFASTTTALRRISIFVFVSTKQCQGRLSELPGFERFDGDEFVNAFHNSSH